jgi:hypothetical protein
MHATPRLLHWSHRFTSWSTSTSATSFAFPFPLVILSAVFMVVLESIFSEAGLLSAVESESDTVDGALTRRRFVPPSTLSSVFRFRVVDRSFSFPLPFPSTAPLPDPGPDPDPDAFAFTCGPGFIIVISRTCLSTFILVSASLACSHGFFPSTN